MNKETKTWKAYFRCGNCYNEFEKDIPKRWTVKNITLQAPWENSLYITDNKNTEDVICPNCKTGDKVVRIRKPFKVKLFSKIYKMRNREN